MKKEIDWVKQANRDFEPVEAWNNAMDRIEAEYARIRIEEELAREAEIKRQAELQAEAAIKAKRAEQAKRTTAALLAKNPNHFKELNEKAKLKRLEKLENKTG